MNRARVLLVEDNAGDARLLREMLRDSQSHEYHVTHVGCLADAEALLSARMVDLTLLDLGLPDAQGLGAVRRAHAAARWVPLVVLTGMDDEKLAVQALKEGAQDYLVKGQMETRGLMRALRYAIERKATEDALFAAQERALVTLNCIGDAVISTDRVGNITFVNGVAETITGWTAEQALGQPMATVVRSLDCSNRVLLDERLANLATVLQRRDGLEIPIEYSAAAIRDRGGLSTGAVVVFRDVSAVRAMSLQMAHAAEHDSLTGLPNRMLLHDRVSQAIAAARRQSKPLAVLFLDLDGFKHINDSLGHPVGDKLLQSVAQRLLDCARGSDTVTRQGGDEFVVLLSQMHEAKDAAVAATRMLQAVARAHLVGRHDLHITTSIGVSVFPSDGQDAETLIKNADTAMYQAKANGRQNFQFFTPAMNQRAVERQSLEEGLRRALERHELSLHYQPKIDFKTGGISGAEALLRWTHPTRGPVAPAQFVPVAEDSGLILPIGQWVLREACEQARAWTDAGLPSITMAVNVSAREFRDENFLSRLCTTLDETGLDPGLLELELTESVLIERVDAAAAILQSLRKKGVQVALDDFGTGYSSLSYLQKFPVDALKIDQSFVHQISSAPDAASIVAAVIGMARNLKLRVVAEGVETSEELRFLLAHTCDEAQGYYFSRPLPPEQFAALLRSGRTFGEIRERARIVKPAEAKV